MKTWRQKFDSGKPSQVKVLEKPFGGFEAGTRMYISSPAEIDAAIQDLAKGQSLPVAELRDRLAQRNNAEFTCPLTTGIFLRIVSECAFERYQADPQQQVTPFWRVLDSKSPLTDKLSFDKQFITEMRLAEGID